MARRRQLQKYEYEREKKVRDADLESAKRALTQVVRDNESSAAQALAAKNSAVRAWEKEKERFDRYEEQLDKCKIYAPQDGMVAYATGDGRRGGTTIEEGAFVRQRQNILTLPSLNKMQVQTAVHESVLDQVRVGLPVTIRVDAFPDRSYKGTVKSVAVLPDQGGWLASDTKVYKTVVTIDEEVQQLKPGMTAVVEIDIETLRDVISVPIQAIVQRGSNNWCYVDEGGRPTRRTVVLGKTNDKFVEIKDGLQEGERVILNPSAIVSEQELDRIKKSDEDGEAEAEGADGQAEAPAEVSDGDVPAKKQQRAEPGKRPGGDFRAMLRQADADGDGKVTKEEAPQIPEPMFERLDENQDGALDAAEMAKMSRGFGRPSGAGGRSPSGDDRQPEGGAGRSREGGAGRPPSGGGRPSGQRDGEGGERSDKQ